MREGHSGKGIVGDATTFVNMVGGCNIPGCESSQALSTHPSGKVKLL
jgi:hypothetical protein